MTDLNRTDVPMARAVVDDRALDTFASVASRAQDARSCLTDSEAALLLCMAAPIARELQQRRAAMDTMADLLEPGRVLFFPAA